jgi:hypothetical protein
MEDEIEGKLYRAKAVERAISECARKPTSDWPALVKRMAEPGFAQVLGALLLERDKCESAEIKK